MHLLRSTCIALVCALGLFAQTDRGTITGTVSDPAGAVVANAPLELINTQTGSLYTAASSATGNYTLSQLPVGSYQLTIAVPGFKTYVRQNLRVQAAQTLRVDATLEVGTAAESVTVTAEASMLRTETAELSTNVTTNRLNSLPILGIGNNTASSHGVRNPLAAAQLQAGVFFLPNNTMRVNGAPSNTMAIKVDGQDATNGVVTFAQAEQQPSVDALEEVAIQTSNYAAEFGQAGAGLFNFTTRSGTNDYHGSAYDYWVNEALWAHQPFNHLRPVQRRNDYGGTLGGPIYIPKIYNGHDRSFFFFNYEEFRESATFNNQTQTVPTDAYRQGDFSSILTGNNLTGAAGKDGLGNIISEGMIYDPATEQLAPNGTRARLQFPGNMIPANRFDTSAVKVQNLIPHATTPDFINNYIANFSGNRTTPIPALKIDHTINEKMKASFYWSTTETAVQYCLPLCGSTGLPAPIDPTRGTFIESFTLRANVDYTLTPTMLLHFGAGHVNVDFKDTAATLHYDAFKELGIKGGQGDRFPVFGGLTGTGAASAFGGMRGMGPGAQSQSREMKPTGQVSLSWVKGNHTYKFGGEIRLEGYPTRNFTFNNGSYTFSNEQTINTYLQGQALGGRFVGFNYASFLLGGPDSVTLSAQANGRAGRQFWSWFAQDTWKLTRKLTLDYGLRWDLFTFPRETYGRTPSFDPTLANPTAGGHPGATVFEATCGCVFAKNYKAAYAPRIGAAYQLDSKTVLRAGFGLSYSMSQGALGQAGTGAGASQTGSNPTYGDAAMYLATGIPFSVSWPTLDPGLYPSAGTTSGAPPVIDQNGGRPARQWMWQAGVQREILPDLVVEASYVGNRGVWWRTGSLTDPNALSIERLAQFGLDWANSATDRTLLTRQVNSSLAGRFRNALPYDSFPTSATVAQSLRNFPQFGNMGNTAPLGKTWYDALQLKATKRFSYGLDFTWTYTYSKELQLGTENDGGGGVSNDIFNRNINKQFSSFSRPHFMVLALNYTLQPILGNRYANLAFKDWTVGMVLQYGSGLPIAAPGNISNNNTSTILRGTWSTRVAGQPLYLVDINCHCYDPARTQVLNPDAWTDTPSGQFSPAARFYNDFRYMRRPQELMSLARIFRIKERVTFTVRAEFNNIFNRTLLRNGGGNIDPSTGRNQTPTMNAAGAFTQGFGTLNTTGVVDGQRQGTIVARLQF